MAHGTILPLRLESVCYEAAGKRLIDALSLGLGSRPRAVSLGPRPAARARLPQ